MGIESLGESLLSGRRKTRKKIRKEENLGALITGGLTVANAMLKKKSEDFLQNENVLSQQMAYEKSASSAAQTEKDWENANNHIGGVNGWFKDKLRPQVKSQADLLIREERLSDMDEYNQYIENQLDTLIGEEDGDGLYNKFSTAFKTASSLAPTSQFNDYIKNKNPAYRNVGSAVAGWLRKENPSAEKALETIASSRYVENQQAYNTALKSYRGGLSANASLELADIAAQEFKQKPDEVITESEIIYIDHGREGFRVKVPVLQQTAQNINGSVRTFQTEVPGNPLSEQFFSKTPIQVAQQVEIETVNAYTGALLKSTKTLLTDPFGVPMNNGNPYYLGAQSTGKVSAPPPTISAISEDYAETMTSPIDSVVMHLSPEKRDSINNVLFNNQDKDSAKASLLMFKQLTYGVSQALHRDIEPRPSPAPFAEGRNKTQVSFPKHLAADLAANMMVNSLLYNQEASADEAPGTPLVQDLRQVVTSDGAVSGVLTAISLEDLNSRGNYNAYQLPYQATVSLFNSALSAQDIQTFNESASEHSKTYVKDMIKASLEAGRVSNGNRSLWAMPLTETGVTGAEMLGVLTSAAQEEIAQEAEAREETASVPSNYTEAGSFENASVKDIFKRANAQQASIRATEDNDAKYNKALEALKDKAKYPNRHPEAYARAVAKEEQLRGERLRPTSLLDLTNK